MVAPDTARVWRGHLRELHMPGVGQFNACLACMATFGVHSCKITWLTFFLYPFSVSSLRTLCKPVFIHTTMACANTHTHAQYNRMHITCR